VQEGDTSALEAHRERLDKEKNEAREYRKNSVCCFCLLHLCLAKTLWGNAITFLHIFVSIFVLPQVEREVHPDVARFFRQEGEPDIPRELVPLIFDFTEHGPYAKYRWRENKRTYTVSLGLDTDYPPIPF